MIPHKRHTNIRTHMHTQNIKQHTRTRAHSSPARARTRVGGGGAADGQNRGSKLPCSKKRFTVVTFNNRSLLFNLIDQLIELLPLLCFVMSGHMSHITVLMDQ